MAILFDKEFIERNNKLKHFREVNAEAKNLVRVIEAFLSGDTTRSQLNKAINKVKILTEKEY